MFKMNYTMRGYKHYEVSDDRFDYMFDILLKALKSNDVLTVNLYEIATETINTMKCVFSFDCNRMSYYTIYAAGYDLIDDEMIALIHDAVRNR